MTTEIIIKYLLYVLVGLCGYMLRSHSRRLKEAEDKIQQLRVDLVKNSQQNTELYNNVQRIDSNIDKLFDKIDDLLDVIRSMDKKR